MAEELGHYYTTVGNILDQTKTNNRKQEHKARRWAIKKFIRIEDFIKAFEADVRNRYELAEFLEVTEGFIDTMLDHFKGIYGIYKEVDGYVIYFDPPYYKKGSKLYVNFYTHADHVALSNAIKRLEYNYWVVTYDNENNIKQMYSEYRQNIYDLSYTVQTKYRGQEIIIYSDNLNLFIKKLHKNQM